MKNNNQLEFIIRYLKKENINIDLNEFQFQIETHPDFPSLLSYHDTLTFFKINNIVAKISHEDLVNLPNNFIAEINPDKHNSHLMSVEKDGNNFIIFGEGSNEKNIQQKEFLEIWTGVILVAEKNEDFDFSNTESKEDNGIIIASVIILCLASIIILDLSPKLIFFELLSSLGIFFAIEALKEEFNIKTAFSSTFCNLTVNTSCESIIKSQKFKLFKNFGLSDISIVFFVGQLFSLILFVISGLYEHFITLTTTLLILAVPITFISIYYQWKIEKKWCPICLGIISVLYLEIGAIYYLNGGFNFFELSILPLGMFVFSYILPLLGWTFLKINLKDYFSLKSEHRELIRFKRNYKLFSYALLDSKRIEYKTLKSAIFIGNPTARLKISIVTSPLCGHCVEAHHILHDLLELFPNDILLNVRFNLNLEESNEEVKSLHFRLAEIYFEEGQKAFMDALGAWFKNKDIKAWFSIFGIDKGSSKIINMLSEQFNQNIDNEILFTPAIVIGENLFPDMYDRNSLKFYINDLLEDGLEDGQFSVS